MLITAFLFAAVTAATGVTPPGDAASTKKTQVPSNPAPSRDELPSAHGMGQWLVDLARHQGHLVGRGDPRSSSLHVLAILKAAVEVDPGCPEAYYWLYDLETRLDRGDAAVEALRSYVKLAPGDEAARLRLFELDLAGRQTAEDRLSFVEGELAREGVPRAYESHLHGQLARHYFERRENGAAAKEVEKALRLNPMNVDARRVAFEMFGETEPSLQRVEMALQLIAANPSQTNLVWGLGEYMDRLGLHGQAQEWFNRAIQFHEQSQTGPVPADYWHKLAVSYFNAKEYERAINAADKALKADENLHLARLLRATALGRLNRADEQAADIALVEAAYRSETDKAVESNDRARLAEIAWFHAFHKRDAEKALKLAEMAMKENEPSALAKLAHAHALRLSGKTDEAIPLLKSLAAFDQLAAYELARIQIEQDKKAEALTTLHKAATLQYDGVAFEMIADLLRKYDESPPVAPQHTRIAEAHNRFNRDVFDYIRRPADFLSVTMKFVDESLPIPGPVRVIFRIENIGPFPITLGEGFMARPLIAVTAMINGSETFDKYLQVLLNAR
ncbi:MAG TPA: tetratricopeptide repeat protein, partial [Phycisphaerae bacterium]|nr:tetratricopeptide repeat protein [Phycisphaerae bacterium]